MLRLLSDTRFALTLRNMKQPIPVTLFSTPMHAGVTTPLFSSTPKMDRVRSVNSIASVTTLWDPSISLTPN